MNKLKLYQVDAFASDVFKGNPAAVCPLSQWLSDEQLQAIAQENNLSETAFIVADGNDYHIRWFTPNTEVALCGHATLASAYVIFEIMNYAKDQITFKSQSESGRTIASQKKMPDEKDEFLEGESKDSLAENKLIEII